MEIKNINFLNIDTLYQIVLDKFYDQNYQNVKFGRNLSQLLNHMAITLELSDVTAYEYLYLKMYSTNITKLYNKNYNIKYYEKNYSEVYDTIISFLTFLSNIDMDNSITNNEGMDNYLSPSGLILGDCVVALSGSQLASIISLEPRDFFIKASNNKCVIVNDDPMKNKLDPDYNIYEDENIKNFIISEFLTGFYKFLSEKATFIDLASDSFNFGKFLSKSRNSQINILNMRNPYIMCSFNDDKPDVIISNLKKYKELNLDKDFTIKNTYFEISICSEFGVFFELIENLPYDKFICLESLNIPSLNSCDISYIPECPDIWKDKYRNRYNGRMENIVIDINKKYAVSEQNLIKRLELTRNYIPYSYSLLLSLDDINNYLNSYIKENENSKDYIIQKTISLIKEIIKFTVNIYKNM